MPIFTQTIENINVPELTKVRQKFDDTTTGNIESAIDKEFDKQEIKSLIKPNQKIALAIGSRGIDKIDLIVKTIIKIQDHHKFFHLYKKNMLLHSIYLIFLVEQIEINFVLNVV